MLYICDKDMQHYHATNLITLLLDFSKVSFYITLQFIVAVRPISYLLCNKGLNVYII